MEGELVTGRRKRFKLVRRLMEFHRREEGKDELTKAELAAREERRTLAVEDAIYARGKTMQLVARMARRPLEKGRNFGALKVVQEVRTMKGHKLEQVVRCGYSVLDVVGKSIFFGNLKRILKGERDAAFSKVVVKESMGGAPGMKKAVKDSVKAICRRWNRRGMQMFVLMQVVPRSGHTHREVG